MFAWPLLLSAALLAQDPPATVEYAFPTAVASGDARMIEIKSATASTVRTVVGTHSDETKGREETTLRMVDTLLDPATQPADHVWSGRRRFVREQGTENGVIHDHEITGLEADIWVDDKKAIHLACRDDRAVAPLVFDELMHGAEAFALGGGVSLPERARIGDEFDLPFATLSPWCFGSVGKSTSAVAHVKFESVDAKKSVARLRGTAHEEEVIDKTADQMGEEFGLKGTGKYEGSLEIDYDLAAKRIVRIFCRGKATIEGDLVAEVKGRLSIDGTFENTITSATGAAVAAALIEKPQFRDVPRDVPRAGVSIALPSHYFKTKSEVAKATEFHTYLNGEKNAGLVAVFTFDAAAKSLKEAGAAFRSEYTKLLKGGTTTDATATSGLGVASAFEASKQGEHALLAMFPLTPGHYVVVKCATTETAWAERSKEWSRILQSLKKLPAAK